MNTFEEYLDDWEFEDRWRAFVERLAVVAGRSEADRVTFDECVVWDVELPGDAGSGLLIWLDVRHPDGGVTAMALAGLLDETGVRCGSVCSHHLSIENEADLTWQTFSVTEDGTVADLAEPFADWLLAAARRPVGELWARHSAALSG